MKLSTLLTYRLLLDDIDVIESRQHLENLLGGIKRDLNTLDIDFNNLKEKIKTRSDTIIDNVTELDKELEEFKKQLISFFDTIEQPYFKQSEQIYFDAMKDTALYKLDRLRFKDLLYHKSTREIFYNRVMSYTSWKYPGLQLGPGLGEVTDIMVALDPLYLADTDQDMFIEVKKLWQDMYQRRLRYYVIDETKDNPLEKLPASQIGLIVAVDYFNFRTLDMIEKYLAGMMHILRPGGTAIFTYNNCDYPIGIDNFQNLYYCYTPGRTIKKMCTNMGFKILASFDLEHNVSWIEIQRPGKIDTLRGGQSIAEIKNLL